MCAHHEKEGQGHGYNNLTGVAWSILVMGLSLAAVIILWAWFGYIGPTFSEDILANQQRTLRENFGLPVEETSDDPAVLQTPPSLRNVDQGQEGSTPVTAVNESTSITNGTSQEGEGIGDGASGGIVINVLAGSSVQGNPDYEPDEAEVPLNENIVWVNEDTVPHTATSGTGGQDPDSGKIFDTSIVNGGEESAPVQLAGVNEGNEVPYYCQVHPYMTSMLTVVAPMADNGAETDRGSNSTESNASSTVVENTTGGNDTQSVEPNSNGSSS
jgi:plastocyanin